MKCHACNAEMGPDDAFCGECGAKALEAAPVVREVESTRDSKYSRVPVILTAGLIFILLFIQSQLESDGLYDDWITTENFRLFVIAVGSVIAIISGIVVGSYIIIRSVKVSGRMFHGFSIFFLTSLASFLGTEALLVMFGPWDYIDIAFSISSAAMFSVMTSVIIVGVSSLSPGKTGDDV